jgi:hypothetical protein
MDNSRYYLRNGIFVNDKNPSEYYDLTKKYMLMAIDKGSKESMKYLENYYIYYYPNNEDLQNYFCAFIKGGNIIGSSRLFNNKHISDNMMIDLYCSNINNVNLNIGNFEFCLFKIVSYINFLTFCESHELKNIKHFSEYISKLLYFSNNKQEYKKYTKKIFAQYTSQIFMEYLNLYYYEYIKKIFAPGGEGYIKTKTHFELITKQQ